MTEPTFLDAVVEAFGALQTTTFGGLEASPVAVLWPDESAEWEPLVGRIGDRLFVITLGNYDAAARRGPAYWLRCVIDRALPLLEDQTTIPIVYLPGVGRGQLRAIEDAPAKLQPIAELQYRGSIFSQSNGRDMTISAFLQNERGGLGLQVAGDNETRMSIRSAAAALAVVPQARLRAEAPLRASFFRGLLAPDFHRLVLDWINEPQAFETGLGHDRLEAFAQQLHQSYGIDVRADGPIKAALALGEQRDVAWAAVWQRFVEAPHRYPNIPTRLRAARPPVGPKGPGLFDRRDTWPQVNEEEELALRSALGAVRSMTPAAGRQSVLAAEQTHGERRQWVWTPLGLAPLAIALEPLARLANLSARIPNGPDVSRIAAEYADWGWQVDDAAIRALSIAVPASDGPLVSAIVERLYSDWLDEAARALQKAAATEYEAGAVAEWPAGTCVLFSDGLRFDLGKRLTAALERQRILSELTPRLTAIPTITPTGKPFASPIASSLVGGQGFDLVLREGGTVLSQDVFRRRLAVEGYQFLTAAELGDPKGRAWTELGDIDSLGHEQTGMLPRLIDAEINALAERVSALLAAGWRQVVVLTDHGWLYLPGGLPKVEMPQHLSQGGLTRKARCARLEAGAETSIQTMPWTWNPSVSVAIPPGVAAFQAGQVYEHGGLSPQECITPLIVARSNAAPRGPVQLSLHWRGLRADVAVGGAPPGAKVDLRRKAGDPTSTLLSAPVEIADGEAKVVVLEGDNDGAAAFLVLVDASGAPLAQETVTVGEDL